MELGASIMENSLLRMESKMDERSYLRVSTSDQKDTGINISLEMKRLENDQSKHITKFYIDEGKSASLDEEKDLRFKLTEEELIVAFNIKKRPEFKKMLFDSEKEKFKLWIPKWDRFSRFLMFQEACYIFLKNNGIEIEATNDPNDEILRMMIGVLSQAEINKTKNRMDDVWHKKFEQGLYSGKKIKRGYKWRYDAKNEQNKGKLNTLIPLNNSDAELIKKAFKLASQIPYDVQQVNKIGELLNENPAFIRTTLIDPYHAGIVSYNGEYHKGIHEAIVPLKDFIAVQVLRGNHALAEKLRPFLSHNI